MWSNYAAEVFIRVLLLIPICGLIFVVLAIITSNRKRNTDPEKEKLIQAKALIQLAVGILFFVCFGILTANLFTVLSWLDPVASCFVTPDNPAYLETETAMINNMDPKWVQEVVDFSANTILTENNQWVDGVVIARVRSTSRYGSPVKVWHVEDGKLILDALQTFEKATASDKPLPHNPPYVTWFTITYATKDTVCLNVETLYNMGLTGGRGGNGQFWYLRHERSGWTVKTKFPYYQAD